MTRKEKRRKASVRHAGNDEFEANREVNEPRVRASEKRMKKQLVSRQFLLEEETTQEEAGYVHCKMVVSMFDDSCRTARGAAMAEAAKPRARAAEAASIVEGSEGFGGWWW